MEKVQSQKNISVVLRSGFIHVTGHLLTCRKLCLAFHRGSTCRHPAGHDSCRVVIIYSLPLQESTASHDAERAREHTSENFSGQFRAFLGATPALPINRARAFVDENPRAEADKRPAFPGGGEKTSGNLARVADASTPRRVTAGTAERGTMAEPNPAETGEVKTLWVGDLVSAPSRRASSCPARQPPIFWFQPGSFSRSDG